MKKIETFLKNYDMYINNSKPSRPDWPMGFIGIFKHGADLDEKPMCVIEFNPLTNSDVFIEKLKMSPNEGYNLVKACIDSGYQPFEDGMIGIWIYNNLGAITRDILTEEEPKP